MKLFHILTAVILSASLVCCKSNKESGVPENAINPDVMNNPASAAGSNDKTKVPVAEYIRQGIDLVLERERERLPGQLSLEQQLRK